MITSQIIQDSIDELTLITGVGLRILDTEGISIAASEGAPEVEPSMVQDFLRSPADSQGIHSLQMMKIPDGTEVPYIVAATEGKIGTDARMVVRLCKAELSALIVAYKERYDRGSFLQNLLLDNMLVIDAYTRARKLRIDVNEPRIVIVVKIDEAERHVQSMMPVLEGILNGMFSGGKDVVTAVDPGSVILIKALSPEESYEELDHVAHSIVDMVNTEAMLNVHVAYGSIASELKFISRSYKEARMAMEVGRIFYASERVIAYHTLGIGRLIYQLPESLCRIFIEETFHGRDVEAALDEETRTTIDMFFDNNLNVSETARQLFVHRNTLVYRIEKLEKATGLDIRIFDDALTFKIALMVMNYLKTQKE